MYTIYLIENKINGHRYIGVTKTGIVRRWKKHLADAYCGANWVLSRAIRKYGKNVWDLSKLEDGENYQFGKNIREPYWISRLKPEYNMTKGGDGTVGHHHTKEYKRIRSKVMKGNQNGLGARYTRPESFKQFRMGNQYALGNKFSMPRVICPMCNKCGATNVMYRWHFNNCKERKQTCLAVGLR